MIHLPHYTFNRYVETARSTSSTRRASESRQGTFYSRRGATRGLATFTPFHIMSEGSSEKRLLCRECKVMVARSSFSKTQLKRKGKRTCTRCVAKTNPDSPLDQPRRTRPHDEIKFAELQTRFEGMSKRDQDTLMSALKQRSDLPELNAFLETWRRKTA